MATTTNYGWTTPDNTDLVKDGALAIRTLGSAIDTSMNTALGTKKAGMVLLNTTSFSAVASQSVNNVFSSTYDHYRVVVTLTAITNDTDFRLRFRVSGADDSNNVYFFGHYGRQITSGAIVSASGVSTAYVLNQVDAGNSNASYVYDNMFFYPFATQRTTGHTYQGFYDNAGSYFMLNGGLRFDNTTSFDGFSIFVAAGSMTGSVSVYGMNK